MKWPAWLSPRPETRSAAASTTWEMLRTDFGGGSVPVNAHLAENLSVVFACVRSSPRRSARCRSASTASCPTAAGRKRPIIQWRGSSPMTRTTGRPRPNFSK